MFQLGIIKNFFACIDFLLFFTIKAEWCYIGKNFKNFLKMFIIRKYLWFFRHSLCTEFTLSFGYLNFQSL